MNLNATLLVQMVCFAIFVAVTMRYIWPPIMHALEARRQKIADGLAAAEQGKRDIELAHIKSRELLLEAKAQVAQIVEQAHARANHIVEESKMRAREEGARLLALAESEVTQAYHQARERLLQEVSGLVVRGAEQVLKREIDVAANAGIIQALVSEVQHV
ncbi:MAG: F0F1 ATP synthase subunit B [Gammaproteobacteria bacterium RIFCSPHIGHO2_12_FULL_45_9]|nr:MAG: F0F1 ATP synthase subunit B [Gammaproteobacteria bacterium RIFCSPHIGHO2_12_FULL_45_9]